VLFSISVHVPSRRESVSEDTIIARAAIHSDSGNSNRQGSDPSKSNGHKAGHQQNTDTLSF